MKFTMREKFFINPRGKTSRDGARISGLINDN